MPYIGKSPSAGVRQRYQYTATASQTTFSGTDLGNLTLTYTDNNFVDVFQNGVLLKGGGNDYTATSGTSVVLATGASASDVIEIIVYDVFSVGNFFNRTDSDSRYAKTTGASITGNLAVTGDYSSTTSGTSNLRLGVNAGNSIASGGNQNTLVGDEAGTALTTGDDNVAIGYQAGDALTTGGSNIAIGKSALSTDDTDSGNVAVGHSAMENANGSNTQSVAVGFEALHNLSTGGACTAVGYQAGEAISTGVGGTFIGQLAGTDATGNDNTCVGTQAGFTLSSGEDNTFIGHDAGRTSNGTGNTCVGSHTGDEMTSANRIVIVGFNCDPSSNTGFDQIVMGTGVNGSGNSSFTFGTDGSDSAIGNGATSISAPSDQRYKENIETSTAGLGFINDLRPVTYKWKMEKDIPSDHRSYVEGSTKRVMNAKDDLYHGFIAQEVKTALDNHSEVKNYDDFWSENIDGRQRLAPAFLIPMLTKAIQELSAKNDALEARIKTLEDG